MVKLPCCEEREYWNEADNSGGECNYSWTYFK